MAIELQGQQASIPSVNFRTVGDRVTGAVCGIDTYDMTEFGDSTKVLYGKDGKPRKQDRILLLVTEASPGLTAGSRDKMVEVRPGQVVSVYVKSGHRYKYYEAKRAHGAVNVGDIQTHTFVAEEDTGKGNFLKVYAVAMARNTDAQLIQDAEAEYLDRQSVTEIQAAVADGRIEEDPF